MPLKTQQDDMPQLNLTSMIDVVFLLIIFFMVGRKFTDYERKLDLHVPVVREGAALSDAPQKRVIQVYRDGQVVFDRRPVTLDQLTAELTHARQEYSDLGVLVRGDAASQFQTVADVLVACRQAGVAELNIAVVQSSSAVR